MNHEYAEWLSTQDWTYFFTGTFREKENRYGERSGVYTPDSARRVAEGFFRPFGQKGKNLHYYSSSPEAYTERYTCMACFVTMKITGRQLGLFGAAGSTGTELPGWKAQDPTRRFQPTARSTA